MLKARQLFYFYFLVFKVYITAFPRWFLDAILAETVFLDSGLVFSLDGPFCSQCIEASSTNETFTRNLAIIAASSGVESAQRHSPQLRLIFLRKALRNAFYPSLFLVNAEFIYTVLRNSSAQQQPRLQGILPAIPLLQRRQQRISIKE